MEREDKICMEHIVGVCNNPAKMMIQLNLDARAPECPHCLRRSGKDGFNKEITSFEKAAKVFEALKDLIEK